MKFLALLLCLALQEPAFTKADVLKLSKAGIGDEVILAKIEQEKKSLKFSAEDLAELKKEGVSEKVLARLAEFVPKAPPPPRPAVEGPPGGASVRLQNLSHRGVQVTGNAEDRIIDFRMKGGSDLPSGARLELTLPAGDYAIAIEGWPTTERVRVPASGACLLTVRGADTEYIDVQTIVTEDEDGRRVVILHNQGKVTPGQMRRTESWVDPMEYYGPDVSLYPYVADTVLLGAGVGAIIGHQYGYTARGAWIGAGVGWVVGCGGWGWR